MACIILLQKWSAHSLNTTVCFHTGNERSERNIQQQTVGRAERNQVATGIDKEAHSRPSSEEKVCVGFMVTKSWSFKFILYKTDLCYLFIYNFIHIIIFDQSSPIILYFFFSLLPNYFFPRNLLFSCFVWCVGPNSFNQSFLQKQEGGCLLEVEWGNVPVLHYESIWLSHTYKI